MAIRPKTPPLPSHGWGEAFEQVFDGTVAIANHARSSRSSKSFIGEGLWRAVHDRLAPGDYLIVQFGANDQKIDDPRRHAAPRGEYRDNLRRFVREARGKGAIPILATPVCRRRFDRAGRFRDSHGDYSDAVRELGAEENVPLLDLQRETEAVLTSLGPENSKRLFRWVEPGLYPAMPDGLQDNSHLSEAGARLVAQLAAKALRMTGLALAERLRT